jgi:UDP-N-acetylglucosamine 2-epimerase (non-hydrolysing)
MKKKILTVFGTRPEAIKMSILAKSLNEDNDFEHRICVTGQHRQMLDQVLNFFEVKPDYDLELMKSGQDLTGLTCSILTEMKFVLGEFSPDLVLVHGDTTTSFATALSAFYNKIPVGHVEAGLRTGNIRSPFPEEANRVFTGRIATWHFAPTDRNVNNLLNEGVHDKNIIKTGNTVIDALLFASNKIHGFSKEIVDEKLLRIFKSKQKILLITGHRRENFGKGFVSICEALRDVAMLYPELELVYPVHLNPNVREPVFRILENISNVSLIQPLSYPDFVYAMKRCWAILTDSGGVQEEAPGLGKPVLVMRDSTERPESVEAGTVKLVGADKDKIVNGISSLITNGDFYEQMSKANNPYGDGKAVERIIGSLKRILK